MTTEQCEDEMMPLHPESRKQSGCPEEFPFELLNEQRAKDFHGQTLKRLKERGGLSVLEIIYNISSLERFPDRRTTTDDIHKLNKILQEYFILRDNKNSKA